MQSYGYVLSNLARHDRLNEAERLLDRVLKGYSKGSKQFDEDGSIAIVYSKASEDGEKQVILKRNVTESCIMVTSDIPLKIFRFGGWIFYLRDIVPTLAFFLLYCILGVKINSMLILSDESVKMLLAIAGGAAAALVINLITRRLLGRNRSFDRICFIQLGGIFSIIMILAVMVKNTGIGIWSFWQRVLAYSPFIQSVGGIVLTRLVRLFSRED